MGKSAGRSMSSRRYRGQMLRSFGRKSLGSTKWLLVVICQSQYRTEQFPRQNRHQLCRPHQAGDGLHHWHSTGCQYSGYSICCGCSRQKEVSRSGSKHEPVDQRVGLQRIPRHSRSDLQLQIQRGERF